MKKIIFILIIPFLSLCQNDPLENCDSIGGLDLYAFPSQACPGQNNAIINLYPSGGTPPYTYSWSNGATTEDLENLGPGLYSVTVTDSNGVCDTISREINEYGIVSLYQSPSCPGGNDGMVYFNSTGCDCNSSFCQWIWELNGDTIAQGDGSTAEETYKYIFNIEAGTYTATIIHPDGCEIQEEIIVPNPIMIDSIFVQNECGANSDGWINLTVNPADSLIQNYLWSTGDTTQDIYNLSAGDYFVIVSDSLCIDTLQFEVENNNIENLSIIELNPDFLEPTFIDAPEEISLTLENSNSECIDSLSLYISASTDDFNWMGAMLEEYDEYGNCNSAWCINISDSFDSTGWSLIHLSFTEEGIYEFNTSMNECSDYGDSVVITVTDSCSITTIEEYQQPHIYNNSNNNLIFNLNEEFDNGYLEIFDLNGKKIITSKVDDLTNISLDKYPNGIYNVRISSPDCIYNSKIIIH